MLSQEKYFNSNFKPVEEIITRFLYNQYSIDPRGNNSQDEADLISKLLKIKQEQFHLI